MRNGFQFRGACAPLIAAAMLVMPLASQAQMQPQDRLSSPQDDRFRLTAGIYSATADTELRLDADNGTPPGHPKPRRLHPNSPRVLG